MRLPKDERAALYSALLAYRVKQPFRVEQIHRHALIVRGEQGGDVDGVDFYLKLVREGAQP